MRKKVDRSKTRQPSTRALLSFRPRGHSSFGFKGGDVKAFAALVNYVVHELLLPVE